MNGSALVIARSITRSSSFAIMTRHRGPLTSHLSESPHAFARHRHLERLWRRRLDHLGLRAGSLSAPPELSQLRAVVLALLAHAVLVAGPVLLLEGHPRRLGEAHRAARPHAEVLAGGLLGDVPSAAVQDGHQTRAALAAPRRGVHRGKWVLGRVRGAAVLALHLAVPWPRPVDLAVVGR